MLKISPDRPPPQKKFTFIEQTDFVVQQNQLEWGCPNGTKYPPRQQIPNRAILPNRARVYRRTDGRTDGLGDSSIPPPLTSLRGV